LWIHKPYAIQVSREEPPSYGFRAASWPLLRGNYRIARWFQARRGDGLNRRNQMALILGEDLDDIPIGLVVGKLEDVITGRKNLTGYFGWRT